MKHTAKLLVLGLGLAASAQAGVYTVDPAASKLEITVGKVGFFSRFGHVHHVFAHDLAGAVRAAPGHPERSGVELSIPSAGLTVNDEDLSEKDRKTVQEHMDEKPVLWVENFPAIKFVSSEVQLSGGAKGAYDVKVHGRLSLRGVEHELDLPLKVTIKGDVLEATGETTLKQTDFGITPNKIALGTVAVKDELTVAYRIVARSR